MPHTLPFDVRQLTNRDLELVCEWERICEQRAPRLAQFLRTLTVREDGRRCLPDSDLVEPSLPILDVAGWTIDDIVAALSACHCEVYSSFSPAVGRLADCLLRGFTAVALNLLDDYGKLLAQHGETLVRVCQLPNQPIASDEKPEADLT